jgi:hypothetical protein
MHPEGLGTIRVARAGVEPATFHFSGERCYQLSYLAMMLFAPGRGRLPLAGEKVISDPDGTRTRDLRRDRAAR